MTRDARLRRLPVVAAALAAVLLAGCTSTNTPAPVAESTAPSASPSAEAAPAPVAEAVTPAAGSVSGGDTITITGAGLTDVTAVSIGGIAATDVVAVSDAEVTAKVPRAAEYQPSAATVEVWAGEELVSSAAPLGYEWQVLTPVDRQLSYAFKHWARENYNLAEFGTMNPIGGDCVNFVSQTLLQRGWEMTDDWYNRNAGADWTGAWIHVPTFDNWLRANQERLGVTELSLEQRDQVKVGDIVMFDWNLNDSLDHTQIVSDVIHNADGTVSIKMIGHNLDTNWRDLDETITVDHPGGYAFFWSVP
ncbi:amidase domain-containing protein [Herbiconiux sp. SYSU D00978]|uniref:amidase domain-containing protein n=1 Tax=Herbiconiux sp. SYSU D00978 TaxID=2812562 RepID=UPI001A97BFFF|nr:amidase domain-containing protein [Herbiconiux sp. SYSU D00978]